MKMKKKKKTKKTKEEKHIRVSRQKQIAIVCAEPQRCGP